MICYEKVYQSSFTGYHCNVHLHSLYWYCIQNKSNHLGTLVIINIDQCTPVASLFFFFYFFFGSKKGSVLGHQFDMHACCCHYLAFCAFMYSIIQSAMNTVNMNH